MVILWESYGDPMVRVRQGTVSDSEIARRNSENLRGTQRISEDLGGARNYQSAQKTWRYLSGIEESVASVIAASGGHLLFDPAMLQEQTFLTFN